MKKHICAIASMLAAATLLAACTASTSESFTYAVSTGEKVEVSLDTTGGYSLQTFRSETTDEQDGVINIQEINVYAPIGEPKVLVLTGYFVLPEYYEEYITDPSLSSRKTEKGVSYYYLDDGDNVVFLTRPQGASVGIFLSNASEGITSSRCVEAFERLTFRIA